MSASDKAQQVERVARPSRDFFQRHFVRRNRPVIISGAMDDWAALSSWGADYLKAVLGGLDVRVEASATGFFPFNPEQAEQRQRTRARVMKFDAFVDAICAGNAASEKYYLAQQSIGDRFPALENDFRCPSYFEPKAHVATSLWFGSAGTVTPLHYDLVYNLFAQVAGSKRFILFAPEDSSRLYPFPQSSNVSHFSRVNIEKPDLERFPEVRKARPLECVLEPGEILFLPLFWWHQVSSLETAISVSFWWKAAWTKYLSRPALRLLYPTLRDSLRSLRRRPGIGKKSSNPASSSDEGHGPGRQ